MKSAPLRCRAFTHLVRGVEEVPGGDEEVLHGDPSRRVVAHHLLEARVVASAQHPLGLLLDHRQRRLHVLRRRLSAVWGEGC